MRAFAYESINKSWPAKFLTSQSDLQVLATRPQNSYGTRFILGEFSVHNRSGSPAVVGIGGRLPVDLWTAGQLTAGGTYTDDTTDAQDTDANDFALTTLTNNDGFGVFALVPFSIVSIVVGTAAAGGSPAWDLAYTLAGGTWWTITNAYVSPLFTATGGQLIWFEPPTDWAPAGAGHGTGVPVGSYGIRCRATTAPTATAGLATNIVLGRMLLTTESVADNSVLNNIGGVELALPPQCDAICAAIGAANPQNRASVSWRYSG